MLKSFFNRLFGKRKPIIKSGDDDGGALNVENIKPELLIFGLGNPGDKYKHTRHNIGFDVIDGLSAFLGGNVSSRKYYCGAECRTALCGTNNKPVLLAKPLTYMNLSGDAVSALMEKYQLSAAECLVIVDDFNIPLGTLRFRKDGSPGGHNGLKSITAATGPSYPRMRVGIGPLPTGVTIVDFVLSRFDSREREAITEVINTAVKAVISVTENGINAAMNKYN